ncbi:methyltransferase [Chitinibacter bivalviorum]|uniref:Methyltransferase n=1 Tax=Chitinibacter bivalviorum TaxID=2739434 RepID=A0A7H9BJ37_9NEIS|nr:class I SAM-dependent methyltransferase [Chitinibacter bivalviorum]QLG87574.1 methyltransferase [Chitinibacter bivalviorum]
MPDSIDFAAHKLNRYPSKHAKELRAWDAADEYLAQMILPNEPVLLVNDGFGALHLAAKHHAAAGIYHLNDSWCSLKAIELNIENEAAPIMYKGQDITYALVKLPKSISLLQAQLQLLAGSLKRPLKLFFSGMQKHVSNGHLDVLKAMCGAVEYLPTQRKARLYQVVLSPQIFAQSPIEVPVPELNLKLINCAGVFAEQKIDIGSRFFIENFTLLPKAKRVADVGCGNGLLSLAYCNMHPDSELFLYDESLAAIQSAKLSFQANFPNQKVSITHHDGLADIAEQFDLILINPPFHQQTTVMTDIALSMFAQAKQCMTSTSELWIVANRHLEYQRDLKKWFKRVECIAQNTKFIVIKAML